MNEKESKLENIVRYFPDSKNGLTSQQIEERKLNKLTNEKKKNYSKTLPYIIFHNVFTFFNMLLLSIAIALICVGSFQNLFFMVIVTLNTLIGIYQENKAKKMVESLKLLTEVKTSVVRDGREILIDSSEIVLDEVVILTSGKEIPVDGFIIDGFGEVNESLLTGESVALKKNVGDKVYAGSFVVSGTIYVKAEKIADDTYVSGLQKEAKKQKKVQSVLLKTLNNIIKWISLIIIPLGLATLTVNILQVSSEDISHHIGQIVTTTAGSLISMIPSGLFLLVSTTLYISVTTLGKKKALVQELYSIESLARSNVLCLDKTGTITDGTMHVTSVKTINNIDDFENIMCSFLGAFKDLNITGEVLKRKYKDKGSYEALLTVPFSSERKYSAVTLENKGTYFLGAPEYLTEDKEVLDLISSMLNQGNRILLFTHVEASYDPKISKTGIPVCLFVLEDHIREDAFDTVKWFQDNDVELKVISGDNPVTVKRIAEVVGIKNADKYISLEGKSVDEVKELASQYTIFGRVNPEQKAAIIKSLKKQKKTVAMTGDGVNDILALKQANCAIAMAAGSEAARNCSHIVLMDSSFSSMPKIVEEGRRVINNIQATASLFLMKTIYAILLSLLVVLGAIFTFPIVYPFAPQHLYIIEFAVIGIPAFLLALQKNTSLVQGNFIKNVLIKAIPGGIALLLSVLLVIYAEPYIEYFHIEYSPTNLDSTVITVACLSLSIVGLIILFKTCLPFNLYRSLVFLGMLLLSILIVCLDIAGIDLLSLEINQWVGILFSVGISSLVYLILDFVMSKFNNVAIFNTVAEKLEKQDVEEDE